MSVIVKYRTRVGTWEENGKGLGLACLDVDTPRQIVSCKAKWNLGLTCYRTAVLLVSNSETL